MSLLIYINGKLQMVTGLPMAYSLWLCLGNSYYFYGTNANFRMFYPKSDERKTGQTQFLALLYFFFYKKKKMCNY